MSTRLQTVRFVESLVLTGRSVCFRTRNNFGQILGTTFDSLKGFKPFIGRKPMLFVKNLKYFVKNLYKRLNFVLQTLQYLTHGSRFTPFLTDEHCSQSRTDETKSEYLFQSEEQTQTKLLAAVSDHWGRAVQTISGVLAQWMRVRLNSILRFKDNESLNGSMQLNVQWKDMGPKTFNPSFGSKSCYRTYRATMMPAIFASSCC